MTISLRSLGDELSFHHQIFQLQTQSQNYTDLVGTDALPGQESIRFKVPQHLGFPGAVLERIDQPSSSSKHYQVYINSFGLTGPSGVLPRHYSEWVIERCKQKDHAIRDFLDIFNHRLISLYHRSWEKYQFSVQYRYRLHLKHNDPISKLLFNQVGAKDDTIVFLGGLFANPVRSAQGLKQVLTTLSEVETRINERVGRWLPVDPNEQTRLVNSHFNNEGFSQLGISAMLGQRVWDIGSSIEIELHTKTAQDVARLMPGTPLLSLLHRVANQYIPIHIKASWKLYARYLDLPIAQLGSGSLPLGQGCALSRGSRDAHETVCINIT
ncbi:type VI secretion system baseplate subunit TssG [Vibrio sp. SCSIO 43136]|uniref:type VI secretion system baseplate subunit TssG n=1 Tax=Vibrio sp. SCSIO 43136 TaxID=2819101 RepID=UPI0020754E1B|nr:type VI secretion system baseplate subunit TssG [Vibrio sp. SCSIO 43136]USD67517.1 type VI secretion system baseplate subunit TssG [Vibrio sp. SCSIO 43136]